MAVPDQTEAKAPDRMVTREELAKHDGIRLPAWVAVKGSVYDVGRSFQWIKGKHQELHFAGTELSTGILDAPHGMEVFKKFTRVGRLEE